MEPCHCQHCDFKIDALDKRIDIRFIGVERELKAKLDAQDRRVIDMERAAARALDKAEDSVTLADSIRAEALDKYKETANEMRASLSDQRRDMMPRAEIESRMSALAKDINDLRAFKDQAGGKVIGTAPLMQIGMYVVAAIIGAVVAFIAAQIIRP